MNADPASNATARAGAIENLFAEYERASMIGDDAERLARKTLIAALGTAPESDWLGCAQRLVLRQRSALAAEFLAAAHERHPRSTDIAFALAGLRRQSGFDAEAETLLREILTARPGHAAAALMLARSHGSTGRTHAAAEVLRAVFIGHRQPIDVSILAMELLDEVDRKGDAAAIAEAEIAAGSTDPRIHAYAATYAIQLGRFERARERYLFAYANSRQAPEWNVPFGLASAQRYRDAGHTDFALFRECLGRPDLSDKARMTLLFALGKAHDDIGDFAEAARYFRQANAITERLWPLSRKQWRRGVTARIAAPPLSIRRAPSGDFVPVFIVGVPRSGTTLTAKLLARHSRVCNRGELRWMWKLAQRLPSNGAPDRALLDALAKEYEAHLKQDDSGNAFWFIDKQPLNLLHVDLILALWPQAKIIHCQRNARDNALSLWVQSFHDDTYALASNFADIAAFQQGCDKLMAHWRKRHPESIYRIRYEELASDPPATIAALAAWLGLADDAEKPVEPARPRDDAISTASLWQARQPVYTRSIGRWKNYESHVSELLRFPNL